MVIFYFLRLAEHISMKLCHIKDTQSKIKMVRQENFQDLLNRGEIICIYVFIEAYGKYAISVIIRN